MDDDSLTLIMFLIVYILFIIYLKFIENINVLRDETENLKCNQLYLVLDSMVTNPEDSTKKFEGCIKKLV